MKVKLLKKVRNRYPLFKIYDSNYEMYRYVIYDSHHPDDICTYNEQYLKVAINFRNKLMLEFARTHFKPKRIL